MVIVVLFAGFLLAVSHLSGILPRRTRLGQFALVYAYEANTHLQPDAFDTSGTGPAVRTGPGIDNQEKPVQYDGDRLYIALGALPSRATQLCVICETSFAGVTSRQGLVHTVRAVLGGRLGGQATASLFDHPYSIAVVGPSGAVRVDLGGLAKVLSAGESWSVVARMQDGVVVLDEETRENTAALQNVVEQAAQASRVTFCNYGVFSASAVRRPGP